MIYTAKNTIDVAQQFYADVKGRMEALGRPRSSLRILPGLVPIIRNTRAGAREIAEEIADLAQKEIAMGRLTQHLLGLDISDLPLDRPIPLERLIPLDVAAESPALVASRYPNLYRLIVEEKPTILELLRRPDVSQGGHQAIVGTAQDVADEMQKWFESDGCDGFGVIPLHARGTGTILRRRRPDPPRTRTIPHRIPRHHPPRHPRPRDTRSRWYENSSGDGGARRG